MHRRACGFIHFLANTSVFSIWCNSHWCLMLRHLFQNESYHTINPINQYTPTLALRLALPPTSRNLWIPIEFQNDFGWLVVSMVSIPPRQYWFIGTIISGVMETPHTHYIKHVYCIRITHTYTDVYDIYIYIYICIFIYTISHKHTYIYIYIDTPYTI